MVRLWKVTVGMERSGRRGDQSASNIGESYQRQKGKGRWERLLPALHLKTLPNRANAFSDKEQDGTLCSPAVSSPASLGLSPLVPAPTGPQPSGATPVSSTVKGAILKTRQKPLHLVGQHTGNIPARPERPSRLWAPLPWGPGDRG